jgi:hypothetical protein
MFLPAFYESASKKVTDMTRELIVQLGGFFLAIFLFLGVLLFVSVMVPKAFAA